MLRLSTRDPGFEQAFRRLVRERRESDDDVARDVSLILADVRNRGDVAVAELSVGGSSRRPAATPSTA
jgi:histidinol dehydrogenase